MTQTLREVLTAAGFKGQGLETAVAVCMAESGGRPMAHNGNAGTGDNSYGLFQINMLGSLGPARLKQYGLNSYDDLYDPATNARVAYKMSNGGTNWQPWTTYTRGTYTKFIGADPPLGGTGGVGAAGGEDGSLGDDTGTGGAADAGTTAGTGTGTGSADPFAIGSGTPLSQVVQSNDDYVKLFDGVTVSTLPTPTPGTGTTAAATGSQSLVDKFVNAAVAQRGDSYVFGAKGTGQADPTAFDCSGLTQWAAHQAGVDIPAGAAHQYLYLKGEGATISVDQALHTPGALLFYFDGEPSPGGEPPEAHVAISLGNGKTIEAANPDDGVDEFNAGGGRFNFAAVIPGIATTTPGTSPIVQSAGGTALSQLVQPSFSPLDDGAGAHALVSTDLTTHTGTTHDITTDFGGDDPLTWDISSLLPGSSSVALTTPLGGGLGTDHDISDLDGGSSGDSLDFGHH